MAPAFRGTRPASGSQIPPKSEPFRTEPPGQRVSEMSRHWSSAAAENGLSTRKPRKVAFLSKIPMQVLAKPGSNPPKTQNFGHALWTIMRAQIFSFLADLNEVLPQPACQGDSKRARSPNLYLNAPIRSGICDSLAVPGRRCQLAGGPFREVSESRWPCGLPPKPAPTRGYLGGRIRFKSGNLAVFLYLEKKFKGM